MFTFFLDPCSVTYFLNEEQNIIFNRYQTDLVEITDYYGKHYRKPDLCDKIIYLWNSTDILVDTHEYNDPDLTLTIPGRH
jgi:hypothetical protein